MTQETFPQTYVKGTQTRIVRNPVERVQARFAGFQLLGAGAGVGDVDYRDLQAQARARGIAANQSKAALVEALSLAPARPEPEVEATVEHPVDDGAPA